MLSAAEPETAFFLALLLAKIKSLVASAVGILGLASLIRDGGGSGGTDMIRNTLTHRAFQIVLPRLGEARS